MWCADPWERRPTMGDTEEVAALRKHATGHKFDGFPVYEGDSDVPTGFVSEPEWKWDDLTPRQQREIELDAAALALGRSMTDDHAMDFMLGEFGIACPHRWTTHEPTHRECRMCRAWEQQPGRKVRVGDRWMRVPEPPPLELVVPIPPDPPVVAYAMDGSPSPIGMEPGREVYRWTGSGYVKVAPS